MSYIILFPIALQGLAAGTCIGIICLIANYWSINILYIAGASIGIGTILRRRRPKAGEDLSIACLHLQVLIGLFLTTFGIGMLAVFILQLLHICVYILAFLVLIVYRFICVLDIRLLPIHKN